MGLVSQAGELLLTVPSNQDALSALQKWMWHLVPTGSLLEEKEERTIWVHEPLVPRRGGESWQAARKVILPDFLLMVANVRSGKSLGF